jgi:phage tail sheath protein FI
VPTPGVIVTSRAERARRGAPTDSGVAFIVGPTSAGTANEPVELSRFADYNTEGLGTRTGGAAVVADAVETYFAEGGAKAYVVRMATADEAGLTAALAALPAELGPGQVFAPGQNTAAAHAALLDHAAATNRTALLDAPQDATAADAVALFAPSRALGNAERGGAFVGWPLIPAVAGGSGTRAVPPSALVAGLIARTDARFGVNQPPAGDLGYAQLAVGVSGPRFTDAERGDLDDGGVNPVRMGFDGPQLYGFTGLSADERWQFLSNQRLRMALTAELSALGEQFLFRQIDGKGRLLHELRGVLLAAMERHYKRGALFGATPEAAYDVDVSPAVNTPQTIAAGEVYAAAEYVPAPFAERVRIDLVAGAVGTSAAA